MKKVTLPLVYKDKVNKNNLRFPLCIFKKAFDNERVKELIKTNTFYIIPKELYGKSIGINIYNSIGIIKSFDLDNFTAEVELFDDTFDIVDKGVFIQYNCNAIVEMNDIKIIKECVACSATIMKIEKSAYIE